MQYIQKLMCTALLLAFPTLGLTSFVEDANGIESNLDAYVGFSFKYNWIQPTSPWAKVLTDHHPGFDMYVGGYINEDWSVDVGYDWTNRTALTTSFGTGESLLGVTNTGTLSYLSGQVRIRAAHVDVNYFWPSTSKPLSGILSLGLAIAKPSIRFTWGPGTLAAADANLTIKGKTATYFRAGIGLQGMFTETMGVRAMLRWENSNRLGGHGGAAEVSDFRRMFRNGHSLSIGLLFKV